MKTKYEEIINLPHHVSKTRPQMPMSDRAAQFAPFAALTGYDSAIKETGRLTDERIELDEEALTALNMRYQLLMDALNEEPEVEIAVNVDIPAPICPELFLRWKRIEATAVHIPNAILCHKV